LRNINKRQELSLQRAAQPFHQVEQAGKYYEGFYVATSLTAEIKTKYAAMEN
jgi:hypothetical protein